MFTTDLLQPHPKSGSRRTARYSAIQAVLQPLQPHPDGAPTPLAYALIHHALEGATHAARAGDTRSLSWFRAAPTAVWGASYAHTTRVVVKPGRTQLITGAASDTPYYILNERSQPAAAHLHLLAAQATEHATAAGLGELVADHAAIIVLTAQRDLTQTIRNSTTTRLPGTVFTDYTNSPEVLGRDLVHEAGHNWLNDALAAAEAHPTTGEFYSPWRKSIRPTFGFLHACWAFPLTVIYTAATLERETGSPHVRDFLAAYLRQQRPLLQQTVRDHEAAVQLLPDPALRNVLQAVYARALALQ